VTLLLVFAWLWLALTVRAVRRTLAVSRPWTEQLNISKSHDRTVAPRADYQPTAIDLQFAQLLETYNDASQTSCIGLFKVELREMQNQAGCGAVLYRTPAGRV
jgi:hypothetical protein